MSLFSFFFFTAATASLFGLPSPPALTSTSLASASSSPRTCGIAWTTRPPPYSSLRLYFDHVSHIFSFMPPHTPRVMCSSCCSSLSNANFGNWCLQSDGMPISILQAFWEKWSPLLLKSLRATTKSPDGSGLLWSNTSRPMVGYGFQDAETKTGDVLFSSVLYWNATRLMAKMAQAQGDTDLATALEAEATKVRASATAKLWNAELGVFMASTVLESDKIDVWANALAGAIGFTTDLQSASIFDFFKTRESDIFYEGS